MPTTPYSSVKAPPFALTLLLVVALLLAQWIGLSHSIAHTGWQEGHGDASTSALASSSSTNHANAASDKNPYGAHSCAALDGATLATTLRTPAFVAPLIPHTPVFTLYLRSASWSAAFSCNFSSRAPPLV